jgi:hypothetical protein
MLDGYDRGYNMTTDDLNALRLLDERRRALDWLDPQRVRLDRLLAENVQRLLTIIDQLKGEQT